MKRSILDKWNLTADELTELVEDNPSLRGIMLGYVAEKKFHDLFLSHPEISSVGKSDDHDRSRKGDRYVIYKGVDVVIEVKSLQSNTVKRQEDGGWRGKVQVDASDRRTVILPNGERVTTTCLVAGEFDLLAVNLFAFEDRWRFASAKNKDLPRSRWKGYTEKQRKYLLATLVEVTWPPRPPFHEAPFSLLDEIVRERARKGSFPRGSFTKTRK
jgi:hypothetical protein